MNTRKMALICPLGQTGPVLTETIDALIQKWVGLEPANTPQQAWPINEEQMQAVQNFALDIFCPITVGAMRIESHPVAFPDPTDPNIADKANLFQYFEHYKRYPEQPCREAVHYFNRYKLGIADQAEKDQTGWKKSEDTQYITIDNVRLVGIPVQSWKNSTLGNLLEDVRFPDDNLCFQHLLFGLHHCLRDIYPTILMSLAGGRKTMSAYGMVSAMMFGKPQDIGEKGLPLLSHVLVNERVFEKPAMYQLPYGAYDLADVPFFPMTDLVGQVLREMNVVFPTEFSNGEKYTDRFPAQDFFDGLKDNFLREFLYRTGSIYTERLSQISVEIGKLIQQGIIFRAIKHDVIDPLKMSGEPVVANCYTQINAISNFNTMIDKTIMASYPLNSMIENALSNYIAQKDHIMGHRLSICPDIETLQLKVNPDFIQLVFFNLIKNSFDAYYRYMDDKDIDTHMVKLCFTITDNSDNITIEYRDNAGGIPLEHIGKIFDFGYSTNTSPSRGFGLFMCRKIMESHGGSIMYDATCAKDGACFILTLPK